MDCKQGFDKTSDIECWHGRLSRAYCVQITAETERTMEALDILCTAPNWGVCRGIVRGFRKIIMGYEDVIIGHRQILQGVGDLKMGKLTYWLNHGLMTAKS